MLHPVDKRPEAHDQDGVIDVWVPLGLKGRGPQEPLIVVKQHMPRVAQAALLYNLRVTLKGRRGEPFTRCAQLLGLARNDREERGHLRDHPVGRTLACLLGYWRCHRFLLLLAYVRFRSSNLWRQHTGGVVVVTSPGTGYRW